MNESKSAWDTVGIIGGQLFVVCVLLTLAYVVFLIVTDGRPNNEEIEKAEEEYEQRKRPQPAPRALEDQRFFDKVEEAQNDFN